MNLLIYKSNNLISNNYKYLKDISKYFNNMITVNSFIKFKLKLQQYNNISFNNIELKKYNIKQHNITFIILFIKDEKQKHIYELLEFLKNENFFSTILLVIPKGKMKYYKEYYNIGVDSVITYKDNLTKEIEFLKKETEKKINKINFFNNLISNILYISSSLTKSSLDNRNNLILYLGEYVSIIDLEIQRIQSLLLLFGKTVESTSPLLEYVKRMNQIIDNIKKINNNINENWEKNYSNFEENNILVIIDNAISNISENFSDIYFQRNYKEKIPNLTCSYNGVLSAFEELYKNICLSCKKKKNKIITEILHKDEKILINIYGDITEENKILKFFEPFYNSIDSQTGLGLSFVKRIIGMNGGILRFDIKKDKIHVNINFKL